MERDSTALVLGGLEDECKVVGVVENPVQEVYLCYFVVA